MKLGRFAGIDVFLHWTFVFAPLALILQSWYLNNSIAMTSAMLVLLLCVFGCVLLHEFGHALTARWFDVQTRDIILTPIGGLARLLRMPKKPTHELVITLAGPAVNLVIALVFGLIVYFSGGNFSLTPDLKVGDFSLIMVYINVFLFAFNLIPAFPMDGGRILRASLASFMPFSTATLIAGSVGQVLAVAFAVYGILVSEYTLVAIGIFVFIAASSEIKMHRSQDTHSA
jgi:Zn-dependent protease